MQQHKTVENYLDSVIPDKISDSTKAELRAEIESHIYDKAEFYIEIGYDEEEAFKKAIAEMGETEGVRNEFEVIYKDSTVKGVLLFLYICTANVLSVAVNLGYWFLDHNYWWEVPSVAELFLCLCNLVFVVVYTIKCCRRNFEKQLTGITCAFALMALGSFLISGILFPILIAGVYAFCYVTQNPTPDSVGFIYIINILIISISAFYLFLNISGENKLRKKPYHLSLKQITAILSVVCACFLVIYGFALAKYEFDYDYFSPNVQTETPKDEYLTNITTEQRNLYIAIKDGDDASETEKTLLLNGFEKQDEKIKNYLFDYSYLSSFTEEHILGQLKGSKYSYYCYTNDMNESYLFDDVISCIIIAYDKSDKIIYKMFIPNFDTAWYRNYSHGEQTKNWFDNLQKGQNTENALEFIRETDSSIIEDEKYCGQNTINTYMVEFNCYHNFAPTLSDLIFRRSSNYMDYNYNFKITAENGAITDFESRED